MKIRGRYFEKSFNTFFPKILFKLSPLRMRQRRHWEKQDFGDSHGYHQYDVADEEREAVLVEEIKKRVIKNESILDLGCNCERHLHTQKADGFTNLTGVDICGNAIEYGREKFGFSKDELIVGSYEKVLPAFVSASRKFDLIYSSGSSLSAVHPSFDIVRYICMLSRKYAILLNEDGGGHAYLRFWEYEFRRFGFLLVKLIRPAGGSKMDPNKDIDGSLAVYQKIKPDSNF